MANRKWVCLSCQSYAGNCRAGCDKKYCIAVSYAFKLPKRGAKVWKEIAAIMGPEIEKGADYCGMFAKGNASQTSLLNHRQRLKYVLSLPRYQPCLK